MYFGAIIFYSWADFDLFLSYLNPKMLFFSLISIKMTFSRDVFNILFFLDVKLKYQKFGQILLKLAFTSFTHILLKMVTKNLQVIVGFN